MSVQTSLVNNGQVINQTTNQNDFQSLPTNFQQQPTQTSQLEITGVSRSSQSIPSTKESNRFRIVKTDADRKGDSIDDGSQQGEPVNLNSIPNQTKSTLNGTLNDQKKYQRGRWLVADITAESLLQTKQLNHALLNGTSNPPLGINNQTNSVQTKNDESIYTNGYIAQSQTTSAVDPNKIPNINSSLTSNNVLITSNQSSIQNPIQISQNASQNSNFFVQPSSQTYQITSSIPSGNIINQPTSQIQQSHISQVGTQTPPIVSNNNIFGQLPTSLPQQTPTQTPTQTANLPPNLMNNQQTQILPQPVSTQVSINTDNTQAYKTQNQQNFPASQTTNVNNSLPNQQIKISSQPTNADILTIVTQPNTQVNVSSQIPAPQTSPKDTPLVKQQTVIENNQSNLSDSDGGYDLFANDSKKSDSGIHDRIAEAMDMVKTHLTQAVRDEIVTLKNKIKNLQEQCNRLEQENSILRGHVSSDVIRQLEGKVSLTSNEPEFRANSDSMTTSFTENANDLNSLASSDKQSILNGNILKEQINLVENFKSDS